MCVVLMCSDKYDSFCNEDHRSNTIKAHDLDLGIHRAKMIVLAKKKKNGGGNTASYEWLKGLLEVKLGSNSGH